MVEKDIQEWNCHVIHWYSQVNNKYMKDYEPSTESSYLMRWNVKNLYRWAMSQLEVYVDYTKKLQKTHKELSFLPEKTKIVKKLVGNPYDKK